MHRKTVLAVRALILPLIVIGVVTAVAHNASADAPLEGTKPAQWRLVWTTNPATTAKIIWNTAEEGKSHALFIGEKGKEKREVAAQVNGQYGDNPVYMDQVQLTDI